MEKELSKDNRLKIIQRKFRINAPTILIDFWEEIAKNNLPRKLIKYNYFTLTLLGIDEVVNYDVNEIRSWFKNKSKIQFVKYFIPIARGHYGNQPTFVAGFDRLKNYIGVFYCNLECEPIFITFDFGELLLNQENKLSESEFLEENVPKVLLTKNVLEGLGQANNDAEVMEIVGADFTRFIEFIKNVLSLFSYPGSMTLETLETSYNINLKYNPTVPETNHISILISKTDFYDLDNKIFVLDIINSFFEKNGSLNKYRFYRTEQGFIFLHDEQLLEFIRKGVIPTINNVDFPNCIYSNKVSDYRGKATYHVKTFETVEEMTAWEKAFYDAPLRISVKEMTIGDIKSVVDYFLDTPAEKLLEDGIDELKILSEEQLTEKLKKEMDEIAEQRKIHYFNWSVDDKIRGYSYIEKRADQQETYFHFHSWDIFLNRAEIIDELMSKTLIMIKNKIGLNEIFSEQRLTDDVRNEVLEKAGFVQVDEYEKTRDEMCIAQQVKKWMLDLKKVKNTI